MVMLYAFSLLEVAQILTTEGKGTESRKASGQCSDIIDSYLTHPRVYNIHFPNSLRKDLDMARF